MKKKIREYTHSSKQREYESKIYRIIPSSEDYVEDMEFFFNLGKEHKDYIKSIVREAIKRIRIYLVKTRHATSIDFQRAFDLLVKTKVIENVADRLKIEIQNNDKCFTNFTKAGFFSREEKKVGFDISSFIKSEKETIIHIAIHEFMHYFTIMFDPEFLDGENKYTLSDDFLDVSTLRPHRMVSIYDSQGMLKNVQNVYSPLSDCLLLNEGFNELITCEIDEDSSTVDCYFDVVKMADLLQFVTGQDGNYRDIFRRTLKTQIDAIGMRDFLCFVDYLNKYEKDRNERQDYNYNTNKNYISAQLILIKYYIEKLKKEHEKSPSTDRFVKGILLLSNRVPILDEFTERVLEDALMYLFIDDKDFSNSDYATLQLTRSLVRKNFERNNVMIDIDKKDVEIRFARINGRKGLYIYGMEISEEFINEMKFNDGIMIDREDITVYVGKRTDTLYVRFMKNNQETYSLIKEAYIDFSEVDEGRIRYKPHNDFRKEFSFKPYDTDEYKQIEQTTSFVTDSQNLMSFLGKTDMKIVKNVRVIDIRETYYDYQRIYMVENIDGNITVFTSKNGKKVEKNTILNTNFSYPEDNKGLFSPKYRIDEDEKRVFIDLADSGMIDDERLLTLVVDCGIVLQKVKFNGIEKFVVFSKGQRIDYNENIIYSKNNENLKFYIETKQNETAKKPKQDESGS